MGRRDQSLNGPFNNERCGLQKIPQFQNLQIDKCLIHLLTMYFSWIDQIILPKGSFTRLILSGFFTCFIFGCFSFIFSNQRPINNEIADFCFSTAHTCNGKTIIVINGSLTQERTHYQSIKSILFCHLTEYNKAAIVHNISTQNCKQKSKVLVNMMKHTFQPSPTHWFGYFNTHCVLLS